MPENSRQKLFADYYTRYSKPGVSPVIEKYYNIAKKKNRSSSDTTDIFEIGNHCERIENNMMQPHTRERNYVKNGHLLKKASRR